MWRRMVQHRLCSRPKHGTVLSTVFTKLQSSLSDKQLENNTYWWKPSNFSTNHANVSFQVLDVEGGDARPQAKLILYPRKHPASENQMFQVRGDAIVSALNPNMVLTIDAGRHEDGQPVVLWQQEHQHNQIFDIASTY